MGLGEAKTMLIICGIILIVTNIFATNIPELSNLKPVSGDVIGEVYDINTGQLTGDGTKLTEWMDASTADDVETATIFDFAFSSWSWVQKAIKMIVKFFSAPYQLVNQMTVAYCNADVTWLCFLKYIVGFIWTIYLSITLIQAVWGR